MEESKLTMLQRQKVNYSLRSGDPLPSAAGSSQDESKEPKVIYKQGLTTRRTLAAIKDSGAYERDKFTPTANKLSRDFAKKHLQDIMEFGKEVKKELPQTVECTEKFENRFEECKFKV